jgi:hypothetical protein
MNRKETEIKSGKREKGKDMERFGNKLTDL